MMKHNKVMEEESLSREMFDKFINDVKKKKSYKCIFIVNGGIDPENALFILFKPIWENEKKPKHWWMDDLIQIHKKGSKLSLENYRFIHIKEEVPKLFGYIVTSQIKDKLIKNMSRYQIGAVPGHMPQEHLFCLRSMISLYEKFRKPLIISFYDIKKFFDKESLVDALDACYKAGVNGKHYRLLYLLNSETEIKVKTKGLHEEKLSFIYKGSKVLNSTAITNTMKCCITKQASWIFEESLV